jgi:hypothetical protein
MDHHRAVLMAADVERPVLMLPVRLAGRGDLIHASPATYDALHVLGRARAPDGEQPRLRPRRGHAGQGADLGVGELPARQRPGQGR